LLTIAAGAKAGRNPVALQQVRRYLSAYEHAFEQDPLVVGRLNSGLANARVKLVVAATECPGGHLFCTRLSGPSAKGDGDGNDG